MNEYNGKINCGQQNYGMEVDVYDPWASAEEAMQEYGIKLTPSLPPLGGQRGALCKRNFK
jgi:hypothetical protein